MNLYSLLSNDISENIYLGKINLRSLQPGTHGSFLQYFLR